MISKIKNIASFMALQLLHRHMRAGDNKVLFISDVRDSLDGNLKFVYEMLDDKQWRKLTYCKDKQLHPQSSADIKKISRYMNTCRYIFLEDVMPLLQFYKLKPGQQVIQLWHAAGAYKKFGLSRTEEGLRVSRSHNKYTRAITSAESIRECYADAYGIDTEKVVATGVPRTDVFFDENWKKAVREEIEKLYPQINNRKIVLFAPTYRGTHISDAGYDMDMFPVEKLKEALGDEFVFITKWHPAMYNNLKIQGKLMADSDFVIDLSHIRDVNSIMPAADILVTDYSSIIFEWSLLDRPIVYYAYDADEYNKDRGLYYPFEDYLFGQVAKTPEELADAIKLMSVDENLRRKFVSRFMNKCDGNATSRVVALINTDKER